MPKLCFITTTEGTQESFIIPALYLFKERGYDVTVICTMSDKFIERYSKDFNCINVMMHRGVHFKEVLTKPFEFYRIFKSEKFDYVQYATTNAAWYASVAAKAARIPVRVNCLWGLLYTASTGLKRKLFWLVEKIPCFFSNFFTVASYKNMEIAIEDGLCKREKVSVIGDGGTIGVDLNIFNVANKADYRTQMIERYPVLKEKTVFGYLGRIDVDKGINELLRAFIEINRKDTALLLIGAFDNLRSGLDVELIEKAKFSKNIIFTGYSREVALHLSAVDILVHPTYREGFSMVIQQAMAMGCAIITTDIPGPSEVIVKDESGLLVPVKDAVALKGAMECLLDDSILRRYFVESGLKRVQKCFNRERMVELTYQDRTRMLKNE